MKYNKKWENLIYPPCTFWLLQLNMISDRVRVGLFTNNIFCFNKTLPSCCAWLMSVQYFKQRVTTDHRSDVPNVLTLIFPIAHLLMLLRGKANNSNYYVIDFFFIFESHRFSGLALLENARNTITILCCGLKENSKWAQVTKDKRNTMPD